MRIFVTGGSGFLGKRMVRRLLECGHDVCCLVRRGSDTSAFRAAVTIDGGGRLETVYGTLQDIAKLVEKIGSCDVVVHSAAAMNGGAPVLFLNNVVATRQFMTVLGSLCPKRLVLVSSLGVYGTGDLRPGDVMDETCPLDPTPQLRDPYSYSKIGQERVVWEAYKSGVVSSLVVIRPGVIYGPGKGCLSARIGLQLGSLMVKMGGGQRVPYTYVDNCADAIALAVSAEGIDGEAFNIIDDDPPKARHVLRQYCRQVQRLRVIPIPRWAIGPMSGLCEWYHRWSRGQLPAVLTRYKSAAQWKPLRYSNAKAKSRLGWTPRVEFKVGLQASCDWSREQMRGRQKPATGKADSTAADRDQKATKMPVAMGAR